jgi:hypothetical protein
MKINTFLTLPHTARVTHPKAFFPILTFAYDVTQQTFNSMNYSYRLHNRVKFYKPYKVCNGVAIKLSVALVCEIWPAVIFGSKKSSIQIQQGFNIFFGRTSWKIPRLNAR